MNIIPTLIKLKIFLHLKQGQRKYTFGIMINKFIIKGSERVLLKEDTEDNPLIINYILIGF